MAELNQVITVEREVEIGGRRFVVGKLTLGDYAKFYEWCDRRYKKEVIETYKMAEQKVDVLEIMKLKASQEYYSAMMTDVTGMTHLLYILLSKQNPELKEDELAELLGIEDLTKIVNIISDDIEVEPEGEGNKKK